MTLRASARGFSLVELLMVLAVAAAMATIAVPVMTDLSESTKLNSVAREIEREYQTARFKAVKTNRPVRVRLNCPTTGYFRTIEVGMADDNTAERCLLTKYPFPAPDNNVTTRPNHDGPVRTILHDATVSGPTLEFAPDGTVRQVNTSGVAQEFSGEVTTTITRKGKSRTVTINGAGRIQLQ